MECLLAPKTKQSYLFLAPLQWPWQGCCWNLPRVCNAVRRSCVPPPPYRHYRHCPPPPPPRPFASIRWPGQAGLTSAGSVAAGSDGCLLGRIHFPCGFVVYVLLCCWGVFPVLTLYSPRSIVWELFFFSSLSSCKCWIFLQFYLHFTTDYTCMIVYVTNNKEPWTNLEPWKELFKYSHILKYCCFMYNTLNNPSAHPSYSHYYLLSPSTLFFAHLIVFCTSYCFALFYFIAHFTLISLFLPYICSCVVLLYKILIFIIKIALSTERTWFDYISLLIIPCIIYYVTNKETLNFEPWNNNI